MDQDLVKRPSDEGLLNLKTPSGQVQNHHGVGRGYSGTGPARGHHQMHHQQHLQGQQQQPPRPHPHHQLQPHPSWVYRANYAPFDPDADLGVGGAGGANAASRILGPVKRSLSFLSGGKAAGATAGGGERQNGNSANSVRSGQSATNQQPLFDRHRIDLLANSNSKTIRKMTLTGEMGCLSQIIYS